MAACHRLSPLPRHPTQPSPHTSCGFGVKLWRGGMTPTTGVTDSRCLLRKGGRQATTRTLAGSNPSSSCSRGAPRFHWVAARAAGIRPSLPATTGPQRRACASRSAVAMSSVSPGSRLPPGKHTSPARRRQRGRSRQAKAAAVDSYCGQQWRQPPPRPAPPPPRPRSPLCVDSLLLRWLSTTCTSPLAGSSNKGTKTAANLWETGCATGVALQHACRLATHRSRRHSSAARAAAPARVCTMPAGVRAGPPWELLDGGGAPLLPAEAGGGGGDGGGTPAAPGRSVADVADS